jgi:archaellum component FlaC
MMKQNRPYSILNVIDNLHGRIPRKICQEVLDKLTEEKHLVLKEYGKVLIYLINQDKFPEVSKDDLAELDKEIATKKDLLVEAQATVKKEQF